MPEQMGAGRAAVQVRLEGWGDGDLDLLRRINAPEMMEHLGGSETEEQVLARHRGYLALSGPDTGRMFRIVLLPGEEAAGNVGYWDRVWRGDEVYEAGWSVLPEFQGRGVAVAAAIAVVAEASVQGRRRYMHAFPSVDNPASNAVCRRAGFMLLSETEFEYPLRRSMMCNDWRIDLSASQAAT